MQRHNSERGFTLIELLTVMMILSILSFLSLNSFWVYRASAAYALVESTLKNSITAAEATANRVDNPSPPVGWAFQNTPGTLQNAALASYLSGIRLPNKTSVTAFYDPDCVNAACMSDYILVQNCQSQEYAFWAKWGDGWATTVRNIRGRPWWC